MVARSAAAMRTFTVLFAVLLLAPLFAPAAHAATGPFLWGSDLDPWQANDATQRGAALAAAGASGMTLLVADGKDGWGQVSWASAKFATYEAYPAGAGALEKAVADAHAKGLQVAARFDVFQDVATSRALAGVTIGGSPAWVDPACPSVQSREIAMLQDMLAHVAVDEVNLDHVRYPADEVAASAPLPCTGGTLGSPAQDKVAVITGFVQQAASAARAARPGVRVSADVFGWTDHGPMASIGQDAAKLAPSLDAVMPMIYPGYYSSSAAADPYGTVLAETKLAMGLYGAKARPWVQGFDAYAGNGAIVAQELKAARDAGASGAAVWSFTDMGFAAATWTTVGAPLAASIVAAPAPTASAAFTASFAPKPGNAWWVETSVSASASLAGVSASVNGGAPVALAKTSWGTWAKSFYVPAAAGVRFSATATDGRVVASGLYAWPSATPLAAPAPAPAPAWTPSFALGAQNSWWVETRVTSDRPVASVAASVNGGAPVALARTSWGSWAKSFYLPSGASVAFRATASDGSVATSAAVRWP